MAYGGAATIEPHESLTGNVQVIVDPAAVNDPNNFNLNIARKAYGIEFTPELALIHEFGHALAYMSDRDEAFDLWSVETENQMRLRLDPNAKLRTSERPLTPDPKTLRLRARRLPTPQRRAEMERRERERLYRLANRDARP